MLIDGHELSNARAAERIRLFVIEKQISVLNIAGPKAERLPEAHSYTQMTLELMLKNMINKD